MNIDKAMIYLLDIINSIGQFPTPKDNKEIYCYAMGAIEFASEIGIISPDLAKMLKDTADTKKGED